MKEASSTGEKECIKKSGVTRLQLGTEWARFKYEHRDNSYHYRPYRFIWRGRRLLVFKTQVKEPPRTYSLYLNPGFFAVSTMKKQRIWLGYPFPLGRLGWVME
jgi:hypothetical protein